MFATLDQIYDEIKTVRLIVTGNGHPDDGMIVKQVRMEEKQCALKEDLEELKGSFNDFKGEFHDYAKTMTNKRSPNRKIVGPVTRRHLETMWMWIVRSTIITVLTAVGWLCGNSEKLNKLMESLPK